MVHVFISYATPDRAVADEVSSWLRAAGHEPFLADDLRDEISVGEDWKQHLYRELREVDAVIPDTTHHLSLADIQGRHPGNDLPIQQIFLKHYTLPLSSEPTTGGCPQELRGVRRI